MSVTINVQNVVNLHMRARSQLLSPLVDDRVNNVLLQTVPDFNEAQLQLTDTVHTTFIHFLLHNTPRPYNPQDSDLGCLVARDQDQGSPAFLAVDVKINGIIA